MSLIHPLARRLEYFVYERVCALSELSRPDRGYAAVSDELATPFAPEGEMTSGAVLSGGIGVPGVGKNVAVTGALSWHGPVALVAPRKQNCSWIEP